MGLVLLYEYRLTVNGLVFGILATGLPGIFRALSTLFLSSQGAAPSGLNGTTVLSVSLFASVVCALIFEDTLSALDGTSRLLSPALVIVLMNLVATIASFSIGGQMFAYLPTQSTPWNARQRPAILWPLLGMVGITTFYTVSTGTSIVHPIQVTCFLLATFCLLEVDYTVLAQNIVSSAGQPTRIAMALAPLLPIGDQGHNPDVYQPVLEEDEDSPTSGPLSLLQQTPEQQHSTRSTKSLTILTLLTWSLTLYLTLTPPLSLHSPLSPSLDLTYHPTTNLDIVISMYSEPLTSLTSTLNLLLSIPSIATLSPHLFIYTKNYHADLSAISSAIPAPLSPASITLKPNIGREGETYLHHILSHWDTLANHTLFLQAETHNPRELKPRIRDYFGPDTGMLPLGFAGYSCSCSDKTCGDRFWEDRSGVVRDTYLKALRRETCPARRERGGRILLSYKGQFIASAARIRGTEKKVYEELYGLFGDEGSWVHGQEYLRGRKEEMSAPVFGFTMERLWAGLLQCGDERVARDCPSLLSGWRMGGGRGDCQCFDHV
ncbi:hypothetical protein C1H76_8333 [Elsinoe australis]|uniref:Uncharacterized protein n=1 Tax=Elsinoe australis TaxID=40998 RepID=A0A4U7AV08_9PEZI|nr:hypothetical protein C1H76_8333 [Elsinoe australis]